MIIKPISDCCLAYKAGLLTLVMIGWAALKFLLSATVTWIIVWIASVIRLFVAKKRIYKRGKKKEYEKIDRK